MPKGAYVRTKKPCPQGCGAMVAVQVLQRHADRCFYPRTIERLTELGAPRSSSSTECWEWAQERKGTVKFPYGYVRDNGRQVTVHRLALELSIGRSLSDGEFACHTCDNPRCFNPSHLYIGNPTSNVRDAVERGRHRTGVGSGLLNPTAKCSRCGKALRPGLLGRHEASCLIPETPSRWYEIAEARPSGDCLIGTRSVSNGIVVPSLGRRLKPKQIPAWLATGVEPTRSARVKQLCQTEGCVKTDHFMV